ncbi:alanine-zipper protein, partial [Bartonella sp. ML69XJBT]|uniref:phage major tropism determinant n=1 Tax=Bartonella sp. ML69XJBT TaxID=3019092 RepID=UPI0031840786
DDETLQKVTESLTQSSEAKSMAEDAKSVADSAKEKAEHAEQQASEATRIAGEAKTAAEQAIRSGEAAGQVNADAVKSLVEEAKNKAEAAERLAQEAKNKADSIETLANEAKQRGDQASSTASTAKNVSEEAKNVAEEAQKKADQVERVAEEAQKTAKESKDTAGFAKNVAEQARSKAEKAESVAYGANSKVIDIQQAVDSIKATASLAKMSGDEAKQTASKAETVAYQAFNQAGDAQQAADGAKVKASLAERAGEEAKKAAGKAEIRANEAKNEASQAKQLAQSAKSTAESAKSLCEQAKQSLNTTNQELGGIKNSLTTTTTTANSAKSTATLAQTEALQAKALAQEAKEAVLKAQGSNDLNSSALVKHLTWNSISLSTPFLVASGKQQILLKKGTHISFQNGNDLSVVSYMEDTIIPINRTLSGGNDYYIYLVNAGEKNVQFVVSLNSTYPLGYTATNSRKIGGFHTLCADVGTISGHPLSGYKAGDILPNSVWCLNHRPYSSPEGMVYDPTTDIWVDIYLQSGTGENTKSAYGDLVTTNRSYTEHVSDMLRVKKSLLNDEQFASAMYGSNEKTNIAGSKAPTPKKSGGHKDTANRRMISHIGCEDGCGYLAQFLSGTFLMQTPYTFAGRTNFKTTMNALLGGGNWQHGTDSGPFFRNGQYSRGFKDAKLGARGCSRPHHFV